MHGTRQKSIRCSVRTGDACDLDNHEPIAKIRHRRRSTIAACGVERMAFLSPFFEYDVFVSYSHGKAPGASDSPLLRWTHALIRELEQEVHAVGTEFDSLQIWRDEHIDPTIHLTDELRGKVTSSGILMIVMSPRYLGSSWCKDELEWFRQQVSERAREQGRIFVIRALQTDEKDWPEFLRDDRGYALVGFRFHDPQDSMPYCWRETQVTNEAYARQLWQLQMALTKRLRELRTNAAQRQKLQAPSVVGPEAGPRRIYLHARAEYAPVNDEVRRILTEDGIAALIAASDPGRDMADWTRESRMRVETARRCEALAMVRADGDERFVGDLLEIGVDERTRIESARGAPLPCAVLDRSGQSLPFDVSPFKIERFDICSDDWRGKFRGWLDQARQQPTSVS
jgi:TIR domain